MEAKIYIAVDSSSPRKSKKEYVYILECIVSGQPVTEVGFGMVETSYNGAVLEALGEALERFRKQCEITICTENEFVLNMLKRNLQTWAENGYITSKGKPVANKDKWMRVYEAGQGHTFRCEPGRHTYSTWMEAEMERRKEQNNV